MFYYGDFHYLGSNYLTNLDIYKHMNFEEIASLFIFIQKFFLKHSEEILHVKLLESSFPSWMGSVFLIKQ